jgi:hypothetical protein
MADIIEEILVKGKRPETFSGGLYGLGGAPGGGGTSGTGIGGLYGLAGPGSYANLARLEADDVSRGISGVMGPSISGAVDSRTNRGYKNRRPWYIRRYRRRGRSSKSSDNRLRR